MLKRTLQELELLDDFLFNAMMNYSEFGEKFSRKLLRIIFQRDFGKLKVIPQRVYYGSNIEAHGARLDVYLEEDNDSSGQAAVYDMEADCNNKESAVRALPRRVRFYQAKIDATALKAGEDYQLLKNVVIIMIVPYDPLGRNRMVYTVRNCCVEEPDLLYDDGAQFMYLYTKGTTGNPPEELKQLLTYLEYTRQENARD